MAINPLQLPGQIQSPQVDWSRLDAIGDSIARYRQNAAETEAFDKLLGTSAAPAAPAAPAAAQPMMPNSAGAPNDIDMLFEQTAQKHGLSAAALRRYAQIESGMRPDAVSPSGKHGGLLQLDMDDYMKRGGKNPFDPAENLEIGAQRLRENKETMRRRLGRDPTDAELYMAHQQGVGGVAAHMTAPDRPAWQSMLSTKEGQAKGEGWAKAAVWGNVPDQVKARFGSVDNITSRDFMELWRMKVEGGGQPSAPGAPAQAAAAPRGTFTPEQQARLRALAASGPSGRKAAMEIIAKQGMPRDPIKLAPDETLIDPTTYQPIARGAPKRSDRETEADKAAARTRLAQSIGWDPKDPQTQIYIATGKHPGEDRMSPTALKIIKEAEDENVGLEGTRKSLLRAKELHDDGIFTGFGANVQTWLGTQLPDFAKIDPEKAQRTEEWVKFMDPIAIKDMSATLKGATTDKEMAKYIGMLSDPKTSPKTREAIWKRIFDNVDLQQKINQQRMDQLRGGSYTKPGGGQSSTQTGSVTKDMVERARSNPDAAIVEARRAISEGRDRAGVIRRLQQMKIRIPEDL